jgi:hypothetical protein
LWDNPCNIQEFAWGGWGGFKFKFAASIAFEAYGGIGGITHSFLSLAFAGCDWSSVTLRPLYSQGRNLIPIEKEVEWAADLAWTF